MAFCTRPAFIEQQFPSQNCSNTTSQNSSSCCWKTTIAKLRSANPTRQFRYILRLIAQQHWMAMPSMHSASHCVIFLMHRIWRIRTMKLPTGPSSPRKVGLTRSRPSQPRGLTIRCIVWRTTPQQILSIFRTLCCSQTMVFISMSFAD